MKRGSTLGYDNLSMYPEGIKKKVFTKGNSAQVLHEFPALLYRHSFLCRNFRKVNLDIRLQMFI